MSADLTYGLNVDVLEILTPQGLEDSATVILHNLGPGTVYISATQGYAQKNYALPLASGQRITLRVDHPLYVAGDSNDPSVTLTGGTGRARVIVMSLVG